MGPQADAKAAAKQVNAVKEVGRSGLGSVSREGCPKGVPIRNS